MRMEHGGNIASSRVLGQAMGCVAQARPTGVVQLARAAVQEYQKVRAEVLQDITHGLSSFARSRPSVARGQVDRDSATSQLKRSFAELVRYPLRLRRQIAERPKLDGVVARFSHFIQKSLPRRLPRI